MIKNNFPKEIYLNSIRNLGKLDLNFEINLNLIEESLNSSNLNDKDLVYINEAPIDFNSLIDLCKETNLIPLDNIKEINNNNNNSTSNLLRLLFFYQNSLRFWSDSKYDLAKNKIFNEINQEMIKLTLKTPFSLLISNFEILIWRYLFGIKK